LHAPDRAHAAAPQSVLHPEPPIDDFTPEITLQTLHHDYAAPQSTGALYNFRDGDFDDVKLIQSSAAIPPSNAEITRCSAPKRRRSR